MAHKHKRLLAGSKLRKKLLSAFSPKVSSELTAERAKVLRKDFKRALNRMQYLCLKRGDGNDRAYDVYYVSKNDEDDGWLLVDITVTINGKDLSLEFGGSPMWHSPKRKHCVRQLDTLTYNMR